MINNRPTSIADIVHSIVQMERDLRLGQPKYWSGRARLLWEEMRVPLFSKLKTQFLGYENGRFKDFDPKKVGLSRLVRLVALVIWNECRGRGIVRASRHRRFLVWANPRRRLDSSGTYEDPYTDELIGALSSRDYVVLERSVGWIHLTPTPTKVYRADFRDVCVSLLAKLMGFSLCVDQLRLLRKIDGYLARVYGEPVGAKDIATKTHIRVQAERIASKWMLRWLSPDNLMIVNAYSQIGLVLAAKQLNIRTVELQHGVINRFHLGYHHAQGVGRPAFPDRLWVFGYYWKESTPRLASSDRVEVLGFPYFQKRRDMLARGKTMTVVFVSQPTIGTELSRFAVRVAKRNSVQWRFIYRLHPNERLQWREKYPWLLGASRQGLIMISDCDTPDLYTLLGAAIWQVGVYSTALFEGAALGCKTAIVSLPGKEYMADLINAGKAIEVGFNEDVSFANTGYIEADSEDIFGNNWKKQLVSLVASLD